MTPVEVVCRLVGPLEEVGRLLGMNPKSPYVWRRGSDKRDPGDVPSARLMRELLTYARANDIPLNAEHLIFGADEAEIEALCSQQQVAAE